MKHANPSRLLAHCLILCAVLAGFSLKGMTDAYAQKYTTKDSKIQADVYHPAKHVVAISKKLEGNIEIKSNAKGEITLAGKLTVKITTLRSGNRRRDRAMWSALGKSRQHRILFFPKSLKLNGNKGTITGTFGINRNKKEVTLTVTKFTGSADGKGPVTIEIKGSLSCDDYKIKKPSLLFVAIKDKVDVAMTLTFAPAK